MSTGGDTKTLRSTSFVGTLKRFFKPPKNTDEGSLRPSSHGPDTSLRTARCVTSDLDSSSISGQLSHNGGVESSSSPFLSRKALLDRQLFAHNSGTLVPPPYRPISVAQAALHHSISDPFENPQAFARRTDSEDAEWSCDQPKPTQHASMRINHHGGSLHTSSFSKLSMRSDAVLPSLRDPSVRSCSLDLPGGANSGSMPLDSPMACKLRQAAACSLPSVDARSSSRSPVRQPAATSARSMDGTATETPPQAAKSTLLAMCPGTPASMRRKHWSLEDYEVSRKIYKGATSAVYKATCRRSGVAVALKVYFLSRVPSNVIHMIVREIKVCCDSSVIRLLAIHTDLVHKNIAMLYAAFQDEKRLVLVQEYAARGDLYGIHRAMNRRMTEAQLTTLVLAPFLDALAYLHSKGICHRDIKPENVLFTQDWRLLVADFGVSIDLNQERAVTRAGTLEYMAPEVERCPLKMRPEENKEKDALAYTTAVDIWATGVLAYELLVGFPPFVSDNSAGAASGLAPGAAGNAFLAAHATCKTLSFPASTSAQARDFISLALAERPEERPTALQLSRHPWLPPPAPPPTSSSGIPHQPPPRRSSGQLVGISVTPLAPSRLGAASLASASNSGAVSLSAI